MSTTYRVNRSDWSGKDGTVTVHADGTLEVEDIGRFRVIEDRFTPDEGGRSDWDFFGWKVVSADGQWSEDTILASGGVFRKDIAQKGYHTFDSDEWGHTSTDSFIEGGNYTNDAMPYPHHRAIGIARKLWKTV